MGLRIVQNTKIYKMFIFSICFLSVFVFFGLQESLAVGEYKSNNGIFVNIYKWENASSWAANYVDGSDRTSSLQSIVSNNINGYIRHLNTASTNKSSDTIDPYELNGVGALIRDVQNGTLKKNKDKLFVLDNGTEVLINDNFINWAEHYVKQYLLNATVESTLNIFKYYPSGNKAMSLDNLPNDGKVDSLAGKLLLQYECALNPLVGKTTEKKLDSTMTIQMDETKVKTHGSYVRAVLNNGQQGTYTGLFSTENQMSGGFESVDQDGKTLKPVSVINTMYTLVAPNKLKYVADQSLYTPLEDYKNSSVTLGESLHTSDNSIVCLELVTRKTFKAKSEFEYELLDKSGNFRVPTAHYYLTQSNYDSLPVDENGAYKALGENEEKTSQSGIVISQTSLNERIEYKVYETDASGTKKAVSKFAFTGRRVKFSGTPLQNPFNTNNGEGMEITNQSIKVKTSAYAKSPVFGSDIKFTVGFDETWGAYIQIPTGGIEEAKLTEWLNGSEAQRLVSEMNPGVTVSDIITGINLALSLSRDALSFADIERMSDIEKELEAMKEETWYKVVFVTLALIGILMIFYSVVIIVAYFLDILNIFGDFEPLAIVTFGGLHAVDDEELGVVDNQKGYVGKKGVFIRAGFCMLCGIILLSGGQIFIWMQSLYNTINDLFSNALR